MLGMIALTSLMILALEAGSILSSFTVKMVFSLGFSCVGWVARVKLQHLADPTGGSRLTSAGTSAAAAAAPPAAGAEAAGIATSVMFNRVYGCECSFLA